MSAIVLATLLDELVSAGAFITEGEQNISVSNLSADQSTEVVRKCEALCWGLRTFDSGGTEWQEGAFDSVFAPFRMTIEKPTATHDTLLVVTRVGFAEFIKKETVQIRWKVACLKHKICTYGILFDIWDTNTTDFIQRESLKSPRILVREYSSERVTPVDIRKWLLINTVDDFYDLTFQVWARAAASAISLSLANEIDAIDRSLKFRGPPKLTLQYNDDALADLGIKGFSEMQDAARWVFEVERETEMRHTLLATEIARAGSNEENAANYLKDNLASALEGAKIAYQMSLSQLSGDTLKALAELRRAVTDETAKVMDATRQIISAVSSALAVGIGIIAARTATAANPTLLAVIMLVVAAYVAMVIASGVHFALIQKGVRKDWQPRLYQFLPTADYDKLVSVPIKRVENALWSASAAGGVAVILVVFAFFALTFWDAPQNLSSKSSNSNIGAPETDAYRANNNTGISTPQTNDNWTEKQRSPPP